VRFLEVILNQLKQAGFVQSRRGAEGGYYLTRAPEKIRVSEVIQFIEGPLVPVSCMADNDASKCSLQAIAFLSGCGPVVAEAATQIYDQTSFQALVDEEQIMKKSPAISYSI